MQRGKYEAQRKPRRINWLGVCFWLALLLILIVGIILIGKACGKTESPQETAPQLSIPDPQPSLPPEIHLPTEPETAPETEPSTEPETEPTEEETEPTEEETEPTEEPTEPTEEPEIVAPEYDSALGQKIVSVAKQTDSKPEVFAGSGPDGFDTTGLIYYCFRQCDIAAPRDLDSQFTYGVAVPKEFLQPGDVVFFYLENPGETEYVGIYTGNDKFIAVSSSLKAVAELNIVGDYYAERFIGARRYS